MLNSQPGQIQTDSISGLVYHTCRRTMLRYARVIYMYVVILRCHVDISDVLSN